MSAFSSPSEPTLRTLLEQLKKLSPGGDLHLEHLHGKWSCSTCFIETKEWDGWLHAKTPEAAVIKVIKWLKKHPVKD